MSHKRQATYDLNRDNCDEELPHEEAGQWKPASAEALKFRPKLKAKRTAASSPGNAPSGLFSGWSFSTAKPAAPSLSLKSIISPTGKANGGSEVSGGTGNGHTASDSPTLKLPLPTKPEDRKREISEKKSSLLKEKQRIENELMMLELEERQIEKEEVELTRDSQASATSISSTQVEPPTPTDEEIELPPEDPWN